MKETRTATRQLDQHKQTAPDNEVALEEEAEDHAGETGAREVCRRAGVTDTQRLFETDFHMRT